MSNTVDLMKSVFDLNEKHKEKIQNRLTVASGFNHSKAIESKTTKLEAAKDKILQLSQERDGLDESQAQEKHVYNGAIEEQQNIIKMFQGQIEKLQQQLKQDQEKDQDSIEKLNEEFAGQLAEVTQFLNRDRSNENQM